MIYTCKFKNLDRGSSITPAGRCGNSSNVVRDKSSNKPACLTGIREQSLLIPGRGWKISLSLMKMFRNPLISSLRFSWAPDYLAVTFGGPNLHQIC